MAGAEQRVRVSRHIAGAPQAVWDAYTDHVAWAEWGGVLRARLAREGVPAPNGVGAVRVLGPPGFAAHEEILSFEPPTRLTYRVLKGGIPIRNHFGEVDFEPEDGGTRVLWRCRFESRLPGLGPLLRALVSRLFRNVLDGLAQRHFPQD